MRTGGSPILGNLHIMVINRGFMMISKEYPKWLVQKVENPNRKWWFIVENPKITWMIT